MADVAITAANVAKVSGSTTTDTGIAGATITAGQLVYLDSGTNTIKLADSNLSQAAANTIGIALHGSLSGQPIQYAIGGDITIGGTVTVAGVYVTSANAGGLAPVADLVSGMYTKVIGVGLSATVLSIINRGPSTLVTVP